MSELFYPVFNRSPRTCDQLKSPIWLLGAGVGLLRQYFASEDRIAIDNASFVWKEDQKASKLYINHADNFDFETVGKRPAIIVDLADLEYPQDVLGDAMEYRPSSGGIDILDRYRGAWNITCISNKPTESWSLATEVKYLFQTYRRYIANTYSMDFVRVMKIGHYQKFEEYRDAYGCQVAISFVGQDNFTVDEESLKVSAITFDLQTT